MYCVSSPRPTAAFDWACAAALRLDAGANALANRLRRDAVLGVVLLLHHAAAAGLFDRALHRIGHAVGVEHHLGVDVAGRAADGLHQRGFAAQKAFLVGVENGDQRDFGQVEALAQEVDADQHVELAQAQIAEQFDALEGVQIAVQPLAADVLLAEERRQVFGQPFGERGDQDPFTGGRSLADLFEQVRHLQAGRRDFDLGIKQARGANHLLDVTAVGFRQFVGAGRGGNVDHLLDAAFPLVEPQRAVVQRAGQAETVLDQRHLAIVVAEVHAADLGHRDVRLVDEQQVVVGKEAHQRVGGRVGLAARERPAVVLDARTIADLLQHLDVEPRSGAEAMGFEQLSLVFEKFEPLFQLLLDFVDGPGNAFLGQHEMFRGVDEHPLGALEHLDRWWD